MESEAGTEMTQDGQVNYSGGLETNQGTPVAQIITMSINSCMYAMMASMIMINYAKVPFWKKMIASSLTLPQLFGFIFWLRNNTGDTRQNFIYGLYLSYYPLLFLGFYEFV